jgi:hypothetical protein
MTYAARKRDSHRPASGQAQAGPRVDPQRRRAIRAEGRAGSVEFHLQRIAGGLYVEREDIPRRGLRTIQSIAFSDPGSFERWCDSDPIRFDQPLLHTQLKRAGGELWGIDPGADAA